MKELVVISGKGGTGKTSVVASLAACAGDAVLADCDVDAADLHLVLEPDTLSTHEFYAGYDPEIQQDICTSCGKCVELCAFDAISDDIVIDSLRCEGCGVCAWFCPVKAIEMKEKQAGLWFQSKTRFGMMFHAQLNIAEDNSGKLVTQVKESAREYARAESKELLIVDGPPGVGCPVISSISGATALLVVTEPTLSGVHDMKRVVDLAAHFRVRAALCINKFDINTDVTQEIEDYCKENNISVVGKIPYDTDITRAQVEQKSAVEYSKGPLADIFKNIWDKMVKILDEERK